MASRTVLNTGIRARGLGLVKDAEMPPFSKQVLKTGLPEFGDILARVRNSISPKHRGLPGPMIPLMPGVLKTDVLRKEGEDRTALRRLKSWSDGILGGVTVKRGIQTSPRMSLEPGAHKKADPAGVGLKHKLVVCERKWTCCQEAPGQKPVPWPQPRVVIVGAGLAGLSAAKRLLQAGVKDVLVLEALSRPGGRVHTCQMTDTKVDLGPRNLYGPTITNMAYNMAVMENLFDDELYENRTIVPHFTSDGIVVSDVERPSQIFFKVMNDVSKLIHSPKKIRSSVKNVLSPKLEKVIKAYRKFNSDKDVSLILSGLEHEGRIRWGDDLAHLSADYLESYVEMPSGVVALRKGANMLLQPLLAVVGSKVMYNKPVQSIRWGSKLMETSKRGSVLCCDGQEIPCDFVICTLSLGVLKAQAETLFSPPLPRPKLDAISNLSFGHVNHIYLEYDKPFWAPGEGAFTISWSPKEIQDNEEWIKGIGVIDEVSSNVLVVSLAGREAVWTESCQDKSIAEEFTMLLRRVVGDPSLPCPKHILRSRWSSDIHFQGAMSYLGLQASVKDQCALMAPVPDAPSVVPPVLLFAGEATVPGRFSTIPGAMLSGYREADRIIDICNKHNGPPKVNKAKTKKAECLPRNESKYELDIHIRKTC